MAAYIHFKVHFKINIRNNYKHPFNQKARIQIIYKNTNDHNAQNQHMGISKSLYFTASEA